MSELKDGSGDGPHLPPDKPNTTPDHHLTKAPLERLSWNDVELDDEHRPGPAAPSPGGWDVVPREEWREVVGSPIEAPREQDLTETDEEASRKARARKLLFKEAENTLDASESLGDSIHALMPRQPPTGHPETRSPRPVYSAPPDKGIDGGDAATSLVMIGTLLGEVIRTGVQHFRDRREKKGPDN